jgi:hypothetical protein
MEVLKKKFLAQSRQGAKKRCRGEGNNFSFLSLAAYSCSFARANTIKTLAMPF